MSRSRPPRLRRRRGAGALEFALVAPLLLGFVTAMVDIARYVIDVQRTAAAATAAADLASQTERFTPETRLDAIATGSEVAVLANAAIEVARPLDLLGDGAIIITVIADAGQGAAPLWQRRWGRADITSTIDAGRMRGISLAPGESAVFAEVACRFRPWLLSGRLLGLPGDGGHRSVAVRRPRLSGPVIR